MTECEVCLNEDPVIRITFEDDEDSVTFGVCRDCATLMFMAMAGRYNEAVKEADEAVRQMWRLLGVEVPT